ncbi:ABC transporter ATP-binding protein [uncultured Brevundimonas sp.]|uniref:ABC transporter ATP-binding protein n=1 Tax=uncultured Brevundimonas sp. TaxID=213418 RepID=UPI0030EE860E|tara:strand:+ start:19737 stop:21425 length:1689 start_codon:yes stop_codon:yes gene_type:complete
MVSLWNIERRKIFAALLATALTQALAAASAAWCVRHIFDNLIRGHTAPGLDLRLLAGVFTGAVFLAFLLEIVQRRLGEGLGLKYTADVRLELFDHHMKIPARRPALDSHGAVLLPFVGDLSAIKQWVSDGLARVSVSVITVTALLAAIGSQSLVLSLAIGMTMAAGIAVLLALGRPLDTTVRELRRRRGALAGFVSGRLASAAAIQMMGRSRSERKKVAARTLALNQAGIRRAWVTGGMRGIAHLTGSLMILVTLFVGMHEIQAGRFTPGTVVGTISLVGLLASAMRDLGRAIEMWYPAQISRERIETALRQPVRRRTVGNSRSRNVHSGLVIDSISVTPDLTGVSVCADPGDIVLVQGPVGAGKSTLFACLAQLIQPTEGTILYRGQDLQSFSPGALRRLVGFASPALPLLKGSLGMNLRYRAPKTGVEKIVRHLADCGIDRLVARLPHGLDTKVRGDGANLSLGERQAVLLARALLGSPDILLIDSVDSHLTPEVVERLTHILREYRGIVLMTASRPEITGCATRIWHIEDGALIDKTVTSGATNIFPLEARHAEKGNET